MVTITVNPSAKQAAYRPIIFEAISDRNDSSAYSVSAVISGTGAKARYTIPSNTLKVGDVITGSGFTSTAVAYNVRQTVMVVVDATHIETDLAYSVVFSGVPFLTKTNDNFKLKASVYAFDQTKITITAAVNIAGQTRLTTGTVHGYSVGDMVYIEGTTDYDGAKKIIAVPGNQQFLISTAYTSNKTGAVRRGTYIGSKRQSAISVAAVLTFRFNVANFLQSALSPNLASGITDISTPTANAIKWYAIYLIEEFNAVDGTVKNTDDVPATDSVLSAAYQAVRNVLQHLDTQTLAAFILGSNTQRFLTNAPKTQKIRVGEEVQLSFLANAGVSYGIKWATDLAQSAYNAIAIVDGRGIVPVNASMFAGNFTNAAAYLQIYLQLNSGTVVSETITFSIDKSNYQNPVRFIFENSLGGFDAFTFTGEFQQFNGNSKTAFMRDLGISFTVADRGETILGVNADTRFEIWSRLLTRAEGIWLAELIKSSNVFIQSGSNLIPIVITNNDDVVDATGAPVQIKIQYRYANAPLTLGN